MSELSSEASSSLAEISTVETNYVAIWCEVSHDRMVAARERSTFTCFSVLMRTLLTEGYICWLNSFTAESKPLVRKELNTDQATRTELIIGWPKFV